MPRTHRCPVVLWRTPDGLWSGRLLDDSAASGTACAGSRAAVLHALKEYLRWLDTGEEDFLPAADFLDPALRVVKVQAVPEYATPAGPGGRRRIVPCAEPVTLRLPYVVGRRESGLICASIPGLDVEFDVSSGERVEEMALHYARQALKGLTPAELLRFLPPDGCELDAISLSPRRRSERLHVETTTALGKMADPVDAVMLRRTVRAWPVEREMAIDELASRLAQKTGCVLITGPSGCGKSSLLREAIRRVAREAESGEAASRVARFWVTSGSRIIAGMQWLGQWQERLEQAIEELGIIEGVLCVESLQELMRLGGHTAESSLAAFLTPCLRFQELRLVVEATPEEVEACERLLPGFLDAFSILRLEALAVESQGSVLESAAASLSARHRLFFVPEAAREAGRLCRRFLPYAGFPGTPLTYMQDAALHAAETGRDAVQAADIRRRFAQATGLPEPLLDESHALTREELHQWFAERLVSQQKAVDAVCRVVLKFKAGLNDPGRPLAVLLFTGPTGTGKTQLARLLGDFLFPNRKPADRLLRLDMSEYSGHGAAQRLLGDAFGEPSDLVKRMRLNPFGVLLLDEVEKASPEIFDALMNVFEEGRLTDALGRVTWFRSTVIIMTSNLGARKSAPAGFAGHDTLNAAQADDSAVTAFFRPEFFNRLDQVVTFEPLNRAAVEAIARREMESLLDREGMRDRRLSLQVSDALLSVVCDRGFDPVYGARPLQRRMEELITTPIARWMVEHPATDACTLSLDWDAASGKTVLKDKPSSSRDHLP